MIDRHLSRRDALAGAGAIALAGLYGCANRSGSPFMATPGAAGAANGALLGAQPAGIFGKSVVVTTPTGAAIQAAIDGLGSTGGTIYLQSLAPFILSSALTISTNNIVLIGQGTSATTLRAASGAVLTTQSGVEAMVFVNGATSFTLKSMTIDTINQNHSSGTPRYGVYVVGSSKVWLGQVNTIRNLGSNPGNAGFSLSNCQGATINKCQSTAARLGIEATGCTKLYVSSSTVQKLQGSSDSLSAGISLTSCTNAVVDGCTFMNNEVAANVYVTDGSAITVFANTIKGNRGVGGANNGAGVLVHASTRGTVIVKKCRLNGNTGTGVTIDSSSGVTVKQCAFTNNGSTAGSGIQLNGGTTGAVLTYNLITGTGARNSQPGIQAGYGSSADTGATIEQNTVTNYASGFSLGTNSNNCTATNNGLAGNGQCYVNLGSGNNVTGNLC